MTDTFQALLFEVDTQNSHGITYPKSELQAAIDHFNAGSNYVLLEVYPSNDYSDTSKLAGLAYLTLVGNSVIAELRIADAILSGWQFLELVDKGSCFYLLPRYKCKVDSNNTAYDIHITACVLHLHGTLQPITDYSRHTVINDKLLDADIYKAYNTIGFKLPDK